MDRKAHMQWKEKERQNETVNVQFQENCLKDLANAIERGEIAGDQALIEVDDQDSDVGEPFMEWLKKDIAGQRR
jgi:hypothetical protein